MKDIKRLLSDIRSSVMNMEQNAFRLSLTTEGVTASVSTDTEEDETFDTEKDETFGAVAYFLFEFFTDKPLTTKGLHKRFLSLCKDTVTSSKCAAERKYHRRLLRVSEEQVHAIMVVLQMALPDMIIYKRGKWSFVRDVNEEELRDEYEQNIYPAVCDMFKP